MLPEYLLTGGTEGMLKMLSTIVMMRCTNGHYFFLSAILHSRFCSVLILRLFVSFSFHSSLFFFKQPYLI